MVLRIQELDGDRNKQQKQDTTDPHDHFPVDVRLTVTPEIIDPGRSKDGHHGANGQHEGDEGNEHGSDIEGESDKNTGNEKEEGGTDPSGDFRKDVDPDPPLNLPVIVDAKGRDQSEDGAEYPTEFNQWIEEV